MKQTNNHLNYKFVWPAAFILISLASLYPTDFLLAATNPNDYVQTTYEPAIFSKTEIINGETFYVTVKSRGVGLKDLPTPSKAARFSYRYLANNKATGEERVLNSFFGVRIEPYPQKQGETYATSNVVPLKFTAGSKAGDYMIIEEITGTEMKAPELGWQNAFDSSRKPEPRGLGMIKYSPEKPTSSSPPISPPAQVSSPTGTPTLPPPPPISAPEPEQNKISSPKLAPAKIFTVTALTVSPASVINGAISVGKVTLNATPSVYQVVQLSAVPNTSLSFPSSVIVRAGSKSGSFSVRTNTVASPTDVTITATLNNSKKTAVLTIIPPPLTLSSLTVSPGSVMNGAAAIGTINLSRAAPKGGQIVTLGITPRESLSLPASITVKAGAASSTFNILTKTVDAPVNATIVATIQNNSQKTAQLTINPTPTACRYSCRPGTLGTGGWSAKCESSEIAQPWASCPRTTQYYRCGFWGMSKCSAQVDSICCKPK